MASVRYEKENALGRVTLARASAANRLTFEMMGELTEALLQAGEECDVILLSGEGEDFCAGRESVRGGVGLPPVNVIRERFRGIVKMNDALEFSPAVTVAVLASDTARIAFPEIREGFPPTVVISHLARKLDRRQGFEMVITGREIDAGEGRRIGMVNHVVADSNLDEQVEHLCVELCALGGDSLRPTKSFYRFAETARPEANADHAVNLIANAIHAKGNVG